ncbi:unnamed protein product [Lampetra planeri]
MEPSAQLPARPPIVADGEIRAAHGHLAQLLYAAAFIQVHAGNIDRQSQYTVSSVRNAASGSCSDNATSSQQRHCTVDIVGQAIATFGTESK